PTPPAPTRKAPDDYTRYQEIQAKWKELLQQGKGGDDPEITKLWAENEEIKNRHEGMPPEAPVATETPKVAESAPKAKGTPKRASLDDEAAIEAEASGQAGINKAGEGGFILNPWDSSTFDRQLSQTNHIEFFVDRDGNYTVRGWSDSGKVSNKPNYGKTKLPIFEKTGVDESQLRAALGDKVTDRIVHEANKSLFESTHNTKGKPGEEPGMFTYPKREVDL